MDCRFSKVFQPDCCLKGTPRGNPVLSRSHLSENVALRGGKTNRVARTPMESHDAHIAAHCASISRSAVLAEEGGLTAYPLLPRAKGMERLRLRLIDRPWTSFRFGRLFSSLWGYLRRKTGVSARLAGSGIMLCASRGFTSTKTQPGEERHHWHAPAANLSCPHCWRQSRFSQHVRFRARPDRLDRSVSSDWFVGENWDTFLFPRQTDDAIINTVTPNSTVISDPAHKPKICPSVQTGQGCLQSRPAGH